MQPQDRNNYDEGDKNDDDDEGDKTRFNLPGGGDKMVNEVRPNADVKKANSAGPLALIGGSNSQALQNFLNPQPQPLPPNPVGQHAPPPTLESAQRMCDVLKVREFERLKRAAEVTEKEDVEEGWKVHLKEIDDFMVKYLPSRLQEEIKAKEHLQKEDYSVGVELGNRDLANDATKILLTTEERKVLEEGKKLKKANRKTSLRFKTVLEFLIHRREVQGMDWEKQYIFTSWLPYLSYLFTNVLRKEGLDRYYTQEGWANPKVDDVIPGGKKGIIVEGEEKNPKEEQRLKDIQGLIDQCAQVQKEKNDLIAKSDNPKERVTEGKWVIWAADFMMKVWGDEIMVRKDTCNIFSLIHLTHSKSGPQAITITTTKKRLKELHNGVPVEILSGPILEFLSQLLNSAKFLCTLVQGEANSKRWKIHSGLSNSWKKVYTKGMKLKLWPLEDVLAEFEEKAKKEAILSELQSTADLQRLCLAKQMVAQGIVGEFEMSRNLVSDSGAIDALRLRHPENTDKILNRSGIPTEGKENLIPILYKNGYENRVSYDPNPPDPEVKPQILGHPECGLQNVFRSSFRYLQAPLPKDALHVLDRPERSTTQIDSKDRIINYATAREKPAITDTLKKIYNLYPIEGEEKEEEG